MKNRYLDALWGKVTALPQSPSHDKEHLERVKGFAQELCEMKGGDMETVLAAAMLHDIARVDPKLESKESAQVAAERAKIILEEVKFPSRKIELVCSAISEHDQPDLKPSTIEAKILKEADFLAGFGAWGILRTAMFQGERGKSVSDLIERLRERMPKRIQSLEYPESRINAQQEYVFVKLFLSLLDTPPSLPKVKTGKYIAFEGISGSGKDTQIRLLIEYLKSKGRESVQISEPSDGYRDSVRGAQSKSEELYLLLADRFSTAQSITLPAINSEKFVLASRCYLSSLVYQSTSEAEIPYILYLHQKLPQPDMVIWLDIPPEIAMDRIYSRREKTGISLGKHERLEKLNADRAKYRNAAKEFPQTVERIDAEKDIHAIAHEIRNLVENLNNP